MAQRARRADGIDYKSGCKLKAGECFLGDLKNMGLEEGQYRQAKIDLQKLDLATFHGTNRGTIGKIINTDVYDINVERHNELNDKQSTSKQRTDNDQATTNKEVKDVKNEKEHQQSSVDTGQIPDELLEQFMQLTECLGTPIINPGGFKTHLVKTKSFGQLADEVARMESRLNSQNEAAKTAMKENEKIEERMEVFKSLNQSDRKTILASCTGYVGKGKEKRISQVLEEMEFV